jgi:hypothetical protein
VKMYYKISYRLLFVDTGMRDVDITCGRHMIVLDGFRISRNTAHISPVVSKSSIPFRDRTKDKNDSKTRKKTNTSTG